MPLSGVCVCVCLSRSCIVSKRIKISSNFFHRRAATPFWLFHHKRDGDIPTGTPLTGASNAGGVGRNRDSEPTCLLLTLQQASGRRPPSRKLWQLYRWSYTAGIRPPSATRDKVTVSVVLQRESDQARSRTIHNHDRSYVWQQGLTLRRRQQNRIELYALVYPKLK